MYGNLIILSCGFVFTRNGNVRVRSKTCTYTSNTNPNPSAVYDISICMYFVGLIVENTMLKSNPLYGSEKEFILLYLLFFSVYNWYIIEVKPIEPLIIFKLHIDLIIIS